MGTHTEISPTTRPLTDAVDFQNQGVVIPPLPDGVLKSVSIDLETTPKKNDYAWNQVRESLDKLASHIDGGTEAGLTVQRPKNTQTGGEFAIACFPLARIRKQNPQHVAQEVAEKIVSSELPNYIAQVRVDGPYINFDLDLHRFGNAVLTEIEELQDRYGEQTVGNGATVVFDTSSPNIAKFMSVGHLRSTVIGESLARIYKASGYRVIRDNHLGDWGTQFGMLGRALELWGDTIPELSGTNPVAGLYKLYVKMHEEIEKEKEELKLAGVDENESPLANEGRAWFTRLENGDPEALKLLEWARTMSLAEFQRVYTLLGVDFEYMIGESHYVPMLPSIINTLKNRGLAQRDSKDRLSINFDAGTKLEPLVVQKSDGSSLYATRDLATLAARTTWFKPEKIIYVVGDDQSSYFQQVFEAFDQWTEGNAPELTHISFGKMKLPGGRKMSTRRGEVVFLEDVLNEAIEQAQAKILESNREFTSEEVESLAKQIGAGAVIYFDLRQGRERDIEFDFEKSLSLHENSATYIQYAHTRAMGILRAASEAGINLNQNETAVFETEVEQELIKHLSMFSAAIDKAREDNQPSVVAHFTYRAADLFNQYYTTLRNQPFVKETDPIIQNSRLRLTRAAAQVIKNGLNLLAIAAPERM